MLRMVHCWSHLRTKAVGEVGLDHLSNFYVHVGLTDWRSPFLPGETVEKWMVYPKIDNYKHRIVTNLIPRHKTFVSLLF